MMQRWIEYAVIDSTDPDEIEGGPYEARANAERWAADPRNTQFFDGPAEIVEREMSAGDWTVSEPDG